MPNEPASVEAPALLPVPANQTGFGVELAVLWVRSLQEDREARRDESRVEEQAMLRAGRSRVAELREQARDTWRGALVRGIGGIAGGGMQVCGAFSRAGGAGAEAPNSRSDAFVAEGGATDANVSDGGATEAAAAPTEAAESGGGGAADEIAEEAAREAAGPAPDDPEGVNDESWRVDRRQLWTGGATLVEAATNLWGGYYDQLAGGHGAAAEDRRLAQEIAQQHAERSRNAQADADDDLARTIDLLGEILAANSAAQGAAILRG